jgi:hypothetical protein
MQPSSLTIVPFRGGWAIKHNGGFLGAVGSEAEARRLAERLVAMAREDGGVLGLTALDPASPNPLAVQRQALASADPQVIVRR